MEITGLLLAIYLGTAPVFWFGNVPPEIVVRLKWAFILGAVTLTWIRALRRRIIVLPTGLLGPVGLLLILLGMVFGFFQSGLEATIATIVDVIYPFALVWTVFVYQRLGGDLARVLTTAAIIFVPFCVLIVSAGLFGVPNWSISFSGVNVSVVTSGFTDKRTGWSNGTALFVPILLMRFASTTGYAKKAFYLAAIATLIGSQLVVGGRAGLLASVLAVMMWICARAPRWLYLLPLIILGAWLGTNESVIQHLRLDRISNVASLSDLDSFSSSRISRNVLAMKYIAERPLMGYGFGDLPFPEFERASFVHNIWLRLWLQAGIWAPVVLAVIVGSLFLNILVLWRKVPWSKRWTLPKELLLALFSVLTVGILISMLEPNFLIGSFQTSALWWTVAGTVSVISTDRGRRWLLGFS